MNKNFLTGITFLLFVCLSACADLTSIFDGSTQTSPRASTTSTKKSTPPSTKKESTQTTIIRAKKTDATQADLSRVVDAQTGQRKPIVTSKGVYYFVIEGDVLENIAKKYKIDVEDLAQINDLFESDLVVGRRLFIPKSKDLSEYLTITNLIRTQKLEHDQSNVKVNFVWPVKEFVLFSKFGMRHGRLHNGLDLSAPRGTPFYAAADGRVAYSQKYFGYGYILVIRHGQDLSTAYAHAQTLFVKKGDKVKQGQHIGDVGNTGRSTGPHLHFEILKGTQPVDPVGMLPARE